MPPSVSRSTAGSSPAKRRKLLGPASAARSSSVSTSSSTLRPISSAPSAATLLEDHDHAAARRASVSRMLSVWESLEQRYARAMDKDDIIDLRSGELVQDRGVLKAMNKPQHYGQLLQGVGDAEDKDETEDSDGLLTTSNKEDEDEEEEEDERRDPTNEDYEDDKEDQDEQGGVATSEDEFGEWDTVPAPPSASPSPNGSPSASRASSPGPAFLSESRPTTPGTLSKFLHANFRPKLEKLAREREESPLPPADDLESFMSAEQSLKARTKPGYLEPETPSDDDEVVCLGYGTGLQSAAMSSADERRNFGRHEDSDDELDDWDTVPAPPSDEENSEEDAEGPGEELLACYDSPSTMNQLMRDSTKEIRRIPPSPKKQNGSASRPRTVLPGPTFSSSEDDAPLTSLRTPKQSATKTKAPTPRLIEIFDTDEEDQQPRPEARRRSKNQSESSPTKPSRDQKPRSNSRDASGPAKSGKGKEGVSANDTDEEDQQPRPEARRRSKNQSGSSPMKPSRDQKTRPNSRDAPGPAKSGKRKEPVSAKKRKREAVEDVQVETQFVERLGSLDLQESDDEIEQGVRHSTPPRSISPVRDEIREYEQPVQPFPRVENQSQPRGVVPLLLPPPQPPVPPLQQQPPPAPQPTQPSNYPSFYIPSSFPYMQVPMQMQMPMATPMPIAPQFYYPSPASPAMLFSTPQVPAPQPQLPQQDAGHEALLTQMLYTLNYLAHQNVTNKTGDQQQPSPPAAAPAAPTDSQGFATPLTPVTSQQEWRVPSTPVTSMPSRQAVYESDSVSHGRSILRVGGSRDRRSGLGLSLDPKGKGKEVAHSDFSDSGSEYESRRAMSVTFSDPPSADTPKGRYAPLLSSPVASRLQRSAAPRPSPLRKSSSNLDMEHEADQQDGGWASPSSSPTKRSGRQPLAPSNTMPSLDRRGSDTSVLSSSAPLSNSSAVLAKARAALSSSWATTSSFTTPQTGRAGRR